MDRRRFTDDQHRAALSSDPGRAFVKTYKGIATVRACPFCNYFEKLDRRLNRFAYYDGGLHSKVAGHIRREHSDRIAEIREEAERWEPQRKAKRDAEIARLLRG